MAVSKYHADYMVTWENQAKKDTDDMTKALEDIQVRRRIMLPLDRSRNRA
jgi:hypothetical protein